MELDPGLFRNFLTVLRDISLVLLALETLVLGLAVLFLVVQVRKLLGAIHRHLDRLVGLTTEVLGTTADTARNVHGTATFVGDRTARPLIDLISVATAAANFVRAFSSGGRDGRGGGSS